MDFFARVLSGNGRLKERAREADDVNQAFKANVETVKQLVGDENSEVYALLDMVYDSSFPEEQIFLKTPSRARLKSNKELVLRLLIGLDSMGVPVMGQLLVFARKHGTEAISESLLTLLELLSPLLESKEAPEFTTDDFVDAMDFEWHSPSRTASPFLNVMASATSSPRGSAASASESPHRITASINYRRAFSDRSMLLSHSHELATKSALDKSAATAAHRPALTVSVSSQYRAESSEIVRPELAAVETQPSQKSSTSYSLDTLPSDQHQQYGEKRHRRKSSASLRQLFDEDAESGEEGSVGSSKRRSSSRRRTSSDMKLSKASEPSPPLRPLSEQHTSREIGEDDKVWPGEGAILAEDRQLHLSRKGSGRGSPSPPYETALWRQDSDGFTVDFSDNDHYRRPSVSSATAHKVQTDPRGTPKLHVDEFQAASPSEKENLRGFSCNETVINLAAEVTKDDLNSEKEKIISGQEHTLPSEGELSSQSYAEPEFSISLPSTSIDAVEFYNENAIQFSTTGMQESSNNSLGTPIDAVEVDMDDAIEPGTLENQIFSTNNEKNLGTALSVTPQEVNKSGQLLADNPTCDPTISVSERNEDSTRECEGVIDHENLILQDSSLPAPCFVQGVKDSFSQGSSCFDYISSDLTGDRAALKDIVGIATGQLIICEVDQTSDFTPLPAGQMPLNASATRSNASDSASISALNEDANRPHVRDDEEFSESIALVESNHVQMQTDLGISDNSPSITSPRDVSDALANHHGIIDQEQLNNPHDQVDELSTHDEVSILVSKREESIQPEISSAQDPCLKEGSHLFRDGNLTEAFEESVSLAKGDHLENSWQQYEDECIEAEHVDLHSLSNTEEDSVPDQVAAYAPDQVADGHSAFTELVDSGILQVKSYETSESSSTLFDSMHLQFRNIDNLAEIKKHTPEDGPENAVSQINQCSLLQQAIGHHRSQSDQTSVQSLYKARAMQETSPRQGSQSDHAMSLEQSLIRLRFAERLESLSSMDSSFCSEGSPNRAVHVVMETMPWMNANEKEVVVEHAKRNSVEDASTLDCSSDESPCSPHSIREDLHAGLKVEAEDEELAAQSREECNSSNLQNSASYLTFNEHISRSDIILSTHPDIKGLDKSVALHGDGLVAVLDKRPRVGQLGEEEEEQSRSVVIRDDASSGLLNGQVSYEFETQSPCEEAQEEAVHALVGGIHRDAESLKESKCKHELLSCAEGAATAPTSSIAQSRSYAEPIHMSDSVLKEVLHRYTEEKPRLQDDQNISTKELPIVIMTAESELSIKDLNESATHGSLMQESLKEESKYQDEFLPSPEGAAMVPISSIECHRYAEIIHMNDSVLKEVLQRGMEPEAGHLFYGRSAGDSNLLHTLSSSSLKNDMERPRLQDDQNISTKELPIVTLAGADSEQSIKDLDESATHGSLMLDTVHCHDYRVEAPDSHTYKKRKPSLPLDVHSIELVDDENKGASMMGKTDEILRNEGQSSAKRTHMENSEIELAASHELVASPLLAEQLQATPIVAESLQVLELDSERNYTDHYKGGTESDEQENELVAAPLPTKELQTTPKADEDCQVVAHDPDLEPWCTSQDEQKNTQYRCDRDIDGQDTMGMGDDILMSSMHHVDNHTMLPFVDVDSGHLTAPASVTEISSYAENELSSTADQCAAVGDDHAKWDGPDAENELSSTGDQCAVVGDDHVKWDGQDVQHQNCDALSQGNAQDDHSPDASGKNILPDNVELRANHHSDALVTESSPAPLEMPLEELWSKENQVLQGLESMNQSHLLHETNLDLHVVDCLSSLGTPPSAPSQSHSSEDGTQTIPWEMSEGDDDSDAQSEVPKLQADTVSRQLFKADQPHSNDQGLGEHLNSNYDQFQRLLSELDAAEIVEPGSQISLNAQNDTEKDERGSRDDAMDAKLVEGMVRCPENERPPPDYSEKGFVDKAGQFIMGGVNIPAISFDHSNRMQEYSLELQKSNSNIQNMESDFKRRWQNNQGLDFKCDDNDGPAGEALLTLIGPADSLGNEGFKDSVVRENSTHEQGEKEDEGRVCKSLMREEGGSKPLWVETEAVDAGNFGPLHPPLDQPLINAKDEPLHPPLDQPLINAKDETEAVDAGNFGPLHPPLDQPLINAKDEPYNSNRAWRTRLSMPNSSNKVDVDRMANPALHGQPTFSPCEADRQSTSQLFEQPTSDIHSSLWVAVDLNGTRSKKKSGRRLVGKLRRCFCCSSSKLYAQP